MKAVISCRFDKQVLERLEHDWQVNHLAPTPGKWRLSEEELIEALATHYQAQAMEDEKNADTFDA